MRVLLERAAIVVIAACHGSHGSEPTDSNGGGDAPISSDAATDAPAGKVAMFIAQGNLGRTMVSCDDGNTWVGNTSWELEGNEQMCGTVQPNMTCFQTTCSYEIGGACRQVLCCSDTGDIPEGVAFGNGAIVGAWSHGIPGALRTSTDGMVWATEAVSKSYSVAFGDGRFVAAGNPYSAWSTDGVTWTDGGSTHSFTTHGAPVRAIGYGDYQGGGRFVIVSAGGGRDILISSDGGTSWSHPTTIPDTCAIMVGAPGGGILGGNDVLLIVDRNGTACRSTDGGTTWQVAPTGLTTVGSQGVWTGTQFEFWGEQQMLTSPDGVTWTATPMTTPMNIGPVARSADGTYVALSTIFNGYDRQKFLRSTDGLSWEQLPADAFVHSHSIFQLAFGYGDSSALCPVR